MNGDVQLARLTRRQALRRLGVSASAALLAACAPIQPPAPTPAPAAKPTEGPSQGPSSTAPKPIEKPAAPQSGTPSAAPAAAKAATPAPAAGGAPRGGTLRVVQNSDILPKNVHTLYFPNYAWQDQVFEPLIRYDWRAGLKPAPVLAESWDLSADGLILTFKLRKGVKYHSGREFGSEDVSFNLLRVREEKVGSQWRAYSNDIADIQTPDASTVVLKFKEPRPGIFDMFDVLLMADRETIDELEGGRRAVGTGPFKWVRWAPNDQLVIARNEGYWRSGVPMLDEINVRVVPDTQSLSVNLESGAADLAIAPPFSDLPRLRSNPAITVESSGNGNWHFYLGADLLQPPLDNQKVRQALNWAIDRKRIVDTVFHGAGQAMSVPWGPSNPAWDDAQANAYTFDLDRAKALLAEAGQGGFEVSLTTNTALEPMRGMAQIIQAELGKVGVRVTIQELEPNRWLELLVGRNFRGLWIGPTGSGNFHPGSLVSLLFPFRTGANASNYDSPRYTDLANRARTEADPAKAKAVYRDLTQVLLDESFVMPFVIQRSSWALSSKVKGMDYTAQETLLLAGAGVEK
jgi:peptide/nickel transport system substrate-binding protein